MLSLSLSCFTDSRIMSSTQNDGCVFEFSVFEFFLKPVFDRQFRSSLIHAQQEARIYRCRNTTIEVKLITQIPTFANANCYTTIPLSTPCLRTSRYLKAVVPSVPTVTGKLRMAHHRLTVLSISKKTRATPCRPTIHPCETLTPAITTVPGKLGMGHHLLLTINPIQTRITSPRRDRKRRM